MLELTNQREAWQEAAKPPLKEKKNNDSGREFNLGDSEEPDEVFFLMGASLPPFLWFKKWRASGERKGIKAIKGLHIEM